MKNRSEFGFSHHRYYGGKKSDLLTKLVLILIVFLILWTPLPFGSVESNSLFWIEVIALTCFFLWIIKLVFLGDPDQLKQFRVLWNRQKEAKNRAPFFYRHPHLARLLNLITFGRWPNKNPSHSMEVIGTEVTEVALPFHSFFGFPVKNTGLEGPILIFLLVLVIQIVPFPTLLTSVISPAAFQLYKSAASAADATLAVHPFSLNAYFTVSRLLQYNAYFMIYLAAVNLIRTRMEYRVVLYSIIASAFFQTGYGLYELFSEKQQIFEYQKQFFLNCATGTFINRNHFCAYIGISLPLLLALLFSTGFMKPTTGSLLVRISRILENQSGKILFRLILIGCILAGVFFSFSLTGIVSVVMACIVFLILYQKIRRKDIVLLISALAIAGIVVGFLGSGFLKNRLGGLEVVSERSRFMAWKDTARIFLHFPITGTGSGTFGEIFPAYRTFNASATFSHAHNELLEFLAENGILIIFFALIFFQVFLRRMNQILSNEDFSRIHLYQIGFWCSVLLLVFHNLVDFSFEIPAVAVTGTIALALVFANYHEEIQSA